MVWEVDIAQEVHPTSPSFERSLSRMKSQVKIIPEKLFYLYQNTFQVPLTRMYYQHIIGVAQICFESQPPLHILVQLVQVHIAQQLTGQIANGHTAAAAWHRLKASDDTAEEPQ